MHESSGTLIGYVDDTYGRRMTVTRDMSGAVRLGQGLYDLMLTREMWAMLVSLGDQALGIFDETQENPRA